MLIKNLFTRKVHAHCNIGIARAAILCSGCWKQYLLYVTMLLRNSEEQVIGGVKLDLKTIGPHEAATGVAPAKRKQTGRSSPQETAC